MLWDNKQLEFYGFADSRVSPYLKAWVMQGTVCVVGLIGEGTSRELTANWTSPFEGDSLGGIFEKAGGLMQKGTGATSVTKLNSIKIWTGGDHELTLTLKFMAFADALREVEYAIQALEEMASPEIKKTIPIDFSTLNQGDVSGAAGRIPNMIDINIGRNAIFTECVLQSVSVPLDGEKTREGHLIRADVSLSIAPSTMLNRSEIAGTYNNSQSLVRESSGAGEQ